MKRNGGTARLGIILTAALGLIAGLLVTVTTAVVDDDIATVDAALSTVSEDFNGSFSGGTDWDDYQGGTGWDGDWSEAGSGSNDSTTDTGGKIFINGSDQIVFDNLDDATFQRSVDLDTVTPGNGVRFSFTFVADEGSGELLQFEFLTGSGFVQVGTVSTSETDGSTFTFPVPASAQIANSALRISNGFDEWGDGDRITLDNFVIEEVASTNPDLALSCGIPVVVVLDESGSIDDPGSGSSGSPVSAEPNVKAATVALANGLVNTGSQLRLAEFSTNARDVSLNGSTAFKEVTPTVVSEVETYFDNTGSGAGAYDPGGFTNYEAGLREGFRAVADTFVGATNPYPTPTGLATDPDGTPLVVFITDGVPNTIGVAGNSPTNNGGGSNNSANAAIDEVRAMQAEGSHVLAVAVGQGVTSNTNFNRLRDLVEPGSPTVWEGTGTLDIRTTDAIKVTDFAQLESALREVVFALCAPSLTIRKVTDETDPDNTPVQGYDITTQVTVRDDQDAVSPFEWAAPTVAPDPNVPPASNTQTVTTNADGIAQFQWTPNNQDAPQPWNSEAVFSETLQPGWTLKADPVCTVRRLITSGPNQGDEEVLTSGTDFDVVRSAPNTPPRPGDTITWSFEESNSNDLFELLPVDIATCTFANNPPAELTIEKVVDSLEAATATDFDFTTASPTTPAAIPGLPSAIDLDGVTEASSVTQTYNIEAGVYSVRETELPFWELTGVNCVGPGGSTQANPDPREVTIDLSPGADVTCTFSNREVPAPDLTITKTPDKTSFNENTTATESSVEYTVSITNETGESLTITELVDDLTINPGNQTAQFDLLDAADTGPKIGATITANDCDDVFSGAGLTIAGNATETCKFTVDYPNRNAFDDLDDVVTVTAIDEFDREIEKSDDAEVDVLDVPPTVLVDKQNIGDIQFVAPSDVASYSIRVENTTNETIEVTSVSDVLYRSADNLVDGGDTVLSTIDVTQVGGIVTATTCQDLKAGSPGLQIAPGAANAYTCEITIDTASLPNLVGGDFLINEIEVSVKDLDTPNEVSDSDPAPRPVLGEPGSIGVTKTDNGETIQEPEEQITFDIEIFNRTLTESLTITEFTDALFLEGSPIGSFTIDAVGEVPTLDNADATFISTTCNTADVIGKVLAPAAGLDSNGRPTNADAITSCQIVLELRGNSGEKHSDTVTVKGIVGGDEVEASNDAETPIDPADPVIRVVKQPDAASNITVPENGGPVTYSFEIFNDSGATDPVELTSMIDDKLGDLFGTPNAVVTGINTCSALPSETAATPIPPGGSVTCQVQATISGEPGTSHVNEVSVQGVDDEDTPTNVAQDTGEVFFSNVEPDIDVTKTADLDPKEVPESGADVSFDIVVTNNSVEDVWITSLTDSDYGDITQKAPDNALVSETTCALGVIGTDTNRIAPGATYSCSFTANVARVAQETAHENTVTAVAFDNDDSSDTATDDEEIPFVLDPPTVEITKTDDNGQVLEPGRNVTYFLAIENTSDEQVTITQLTDTINFEDPASTIGPIDLLGGPTGRLVSTTCDPVDLAVGEIYNCEFVIDLTGLTSQTVDDIVFVEVKDEDAKNDRVPPGTDTDTEDTPIEDVPPVVEVVKTADADRVEPGEPVTFTFTVFNRSTIEDIEIVEFFDDVFTFGPTECDIIGDTLTPNDGNDASGDDQISCEITRVLQPGPSDDPSDFDHMNVVTVRAVDDEIEKSQGSENPKDPVEDTDDEKVEVREPGTISVDKVATPAGREFTFELDGG
ncbi:MAG: hypothetical protein AAFY28_10370, partial [Actinomycetota bacterium]